MTPTSLTKKCSNTPHLGPCGWLSPPNIFPFSKSTSDSAIQRMSSTFSWAFLSAKWLIFLRLIVLSRAQLQHRHNFYLYLSFHLLIDCFSLLTILYLFNFDCLSLVNIISVMEVSSYQPFWHPSPWRAVHPFIVFAFFILTSLLSRTCRHQSPWRGIHISIVFQFFILYSLLSSTCRHPSPWKPIHPSIFIAFFNLYILLSSTCRHPSPWRAIHPSILFAFFILYSLLSSPCRYLSHWRSIHPYIHWCHSLFYIHYYT